jgi:enamine deaminase RidA (YjgF/YER057c/UK114 family)
MAKVLSFACFSADPSFAGKQGEASMWPAKHSAGPILQVLEEAKMEKKFVNPPTLATPQGAYTQVVSVEGAGKLIFVAGQVASDAHGHLVGKGDLGAQVRQAHANLAAALAAVGATPADIVKINTYVVNYKPEHLAVIREARLGFFSSEPPASTLVGVAALALEGLLVEVEATAVVR